MYYQGNIDIVSYCEDFNGATPYCCDNKECFMLRFYGVCYACMHTPYANVHTIMSMSAVPFNFHYYMDQDCITSPDTKSRPLYDLYMILAVRKGLTLDYVARVRLCSGLSIIKSTYNPYAAVD